MNDDLFANLPEVKSPRLLWMERHEITTRAIVNSLGVNYTATWEDEGAIVTGRGKTEHDAIVDLALKLNLKLWNEE